jgi:hypothetical protein
MKKYFVGVFIFIFMFTLVSAENIGNFQVDQPMEITNYCQAGVCTYITLVSLELPNGSIVYPDASMTKNNQAYNYSYTPDQIGEYTFVTCGDSLIAICDSDTFDVSYNGQDTFVGVNIILLIFFSSFIILFMYLHKKVNFDKWYSSIMKKYEHKNYFKMTMSMVGYNLIKNTFGIYYLIGFPIMIILTDIVLTYNITSLIGFMTISMYIYAWGVLLIGLMLGGQLQEFIYRIVDDAKNLNWGISNE